MPRIQMTNLMCLAGGGGERITIAVVNFVSVNMLFSLVKMFIKVLIFVPMDMLLSFVLVDLFRTEKNEVLKIN